MTPKSLLFFRQTKRGGLRKLYAVVAPENAGAVAFIKLAGASSVLLRA
jgi:hypothetical protein